MVWYFEGFTVLDDRVWAWPFKRESQELGAAALFLPVVSRISVRTELPLSRLLMPMGFCAILGGTVTMVGSSPLILLNDLILSSNDALPADKQMETFSMIRLSCSVVQQHVAPLVTGTQNQLDPQRPCSNSHPCMQMENPT